MVERPKIAVRQIYISAAPHNLRRKYGTWWGISLKGCYSIKPVLPSTASNIRLLALLYHFLIIYCPIYLQSFAHLWNDSLIWRQGGVMIVMVAKSFSRISAPQKYKLWLSFIVINNFPDNFHIANIPQMCTDIESICLFAHYSSLKTRWVFKLLPYWENRWHFCGLLHGVGYKLGGSPLVNKQPLWFCIFY